MTSLVSQEIGFITGTLVVFSENDMHTTWVHRKDVGKKLNIKAEKGPSSLKDTSVGHAVETTPMVVQ